MGNQIVGIAPSQIFPVEQYLSDYNELKFDTSLGSTRFLKVARAESPEGYIVVKVFVIHDPSLPLSPYRDRLDELKVKLSTAVNCLPFQKIEVNEKAGILMREYVKHSLYDRISTRPFLTHVEKLWITFQILYSLYQCHKVGVCHGDIKLENITITSWNWVLLVDFASFKPTFLPEDNPADYSYFFDTSRRRTCNIAPERFIKTLGSESHPVFNEVLHPSGDLKPSMDIFSAGCALLELWNEGHAPFEYSQLLAYRTGEYTPQKHLDSIVDASLKNLISSMIQRDPNLRLSAELYLSQERGRLFPEYFYSFLQSYMLIFSSSPIVSSDEKISRLKKDIGNIFKFLKSSVSSKSDEEVEKADQEKDGSVNDNDGLVIITALVTSCVRGLHDCTSKLQCLEILLELAGHANNETILDRIIPYVLYLVQDQNARVKVAAINALTKCLNLVENIPRSDANIFPEYILPGLSHLITDPNTSVRVAYAQNIAILAEISVRFLEQVQTDVCDKTNVKHRDAPRVNYEVELQTLHEMVQLTVSALLTDSQPLVKQTLLENGITKLCVFFGKQKANDVLLLHMITFLNDKEDKELRETFFDCIVGVAAYIGWHCSSKLTPLLLQGLTDTSEFVVAKSINAMSSLAELGLLGKATIKELVSETACFLVHPNLWVRQAVVGFISTSAKVLSVLDVQCKVMPSLQIYMKYHLIQIDKAELLLESLVDPIPRSVYDSILAYPDIDSFFETLQLRRNAIESAASGKFPSNDYQKDMHPTLKNLFRRLAATGITDAVEKYLLKMSGHLKKIHKYRNTGSTHDKQTEGRIELTRSETSIHSHVCNLSNKAEYVPSHRRLDRLHIRDSIDITANIEWNPDILNKHSDSNSGSTHSKSLSSRPSSPPPESGTPFSSSDPSSNLSIPEKSYIQYRRASCNIELNTLINRQQDHYFETLRNKERQEQAAWQPQLPPPGWRLRGSLVAHLHEHHSPVTKLQTLPDTSLFASSSLDGFVRIWDCAKIEGKNIANRSRQSYKGPTGSGVTSMTVCENGQSIAAAFVDGSVSLLRIDSTSSKMNVVQTMQVNQEDDAFAVDIHYLDSGPQSTVIYATLYGALVGWDVRAPGVAWRLENGLKQGVITSFCVDAQQNWLTLGTSSGFHVSWDLRFKLPITTIEHPSGTRIRKVVCHPTEPSWILSSVQGNNEISMWNLETGFREKVLWGSKTPPLSKTSVTSHSVCAMQAGCIDRSGFLLAGGTDQRLRFWDLESPSESYLALHAANDPLLGVTPTYKSRLIDGTCVIHEVIETSANKPLGEKCDDVPRAGPEPPPAGHRECISEVTLCKATQCFLVTASRDGIIKVWK